MLSQHCYKTPPSLFKKKKKLAITFKCQSSRNYVNRFRSSLPSAFLFTSDPARRPDEGTTLPSKVPQSQGRTPDRGATPADLPDCLAQPQTSPVSTPTTIVRGMTLLFLPHSAAPPLCASVSTSGVPRRWRQRPRTTSDEGAVGTGKQEAPGH